MTRAGSIACSLPSDRRLLSAHHRRDTDSAKAATSSRADRLGVFVAIAATVVASACAQAGERPPSESQAAAKQRDARMAVPPGLACARDRLTSYAGVVSAYERSEGGLRIEIRTDWDTVESVVVPGVDESVLRGQFRLHGAPFSGSDWPRIEFAPGVQRPGLRAIAWVCEDGRTLPVIDWRPNESAPSLR